MGIEELDTVLKKIKNRKASSLDKISTEVWKTKKYDDILLQLNNTVYKQNIIEKEVKNCILLFFKQHDLRIIKIDWA